MSPIRIAFVDHTAELSGGELALLNLVRHLDRSHYEPVVVLFSDGPLVERLRDSKIEMHVLPLAKSVTATRKDRLGLHSLLRVGDVGRTIVYTIRLSRLIRRLDVKIIHANSLKSDLIGGLAGRIARRPVIWHVHDRIETGYLPRTIAAAFRRLARIVPNTVIGNSRSTLATLELSSTARATVVSPGVVIPAHDDLGAPRPMDVRSPRIGIVGRIAPWKGQDVFLRAAKQVLGRHPTSRFLVVGASLFGEQEYEREIRAAVRAMEIEDRVEFTGHRDDVGDLMRGLDVVVHASTRPEPFGQVIVEAMSLGVPVVATNGGGVPEIVTHGETGLLVPMGDARALAEAVMTVLDEPDAARAMAERASSVVRERFSIESTVAAVQAIYETMLPRAGPTTGQPFGAHRCSVAATPSGG